MTSPQNSRVESLARETWEKSTQQGFSAGEMLGVLYLLAEQISIQCGVSIETVLRDVALEPARPPARQVNSGTQ